MKKRHDPITEGALDAVAYEQRMVDLGKLQLKKREISAAVTFEEIGKVKAMSFSKAQSEFLTLILLKRLKESKAYKDDLDMTWQQICDMVGMSRADVDRKLVDLKSFSDELLLSFSNFAGFDYSKIKYLADAQRSGIAQIEQKSLVYNGTRIPISADHQEDLQAVLDQIQADLGKRADEAEHEVRAAKRVLKDKETLINKQAKEIDRYAGRARDKDLTPEEDGFLAQMEQARIGFDGYMLTIEPSKMDELQAEGTVTPRMRAAYIEVLGYMRKQIRAAHDTAVENYGADLEERA